MSVVVREDPAFRVRQQHVLALGLAGALAVGYSAVFGPLVAGSVVLIVGALVAVTLRPWTMLTLMVGAAAPLAGLRRGVPIPFLRLGEALILAGSIVALVFLDRLHHQRWRWFEVFLVEYVVLTIVVGVIAMRRQGISPTTENIGVLIVPVFHALAFFGARVLGARPDRSRTGLRWLLIGSAAMSMLGVLQYLKAPLVDIIIRTVGDPTEYDINVAAGYVARATGTFNHWHLLAGYLFVMITLAVALLLDEEQQVMSRLALVTVIAVDAIALLLTLTYTAFIGTVLASVIVGVLSGRGAKVFMRVALAACFMGVVFSGVLSGRASDQFSAGSVTGSNPWIPQTVQFRFQVWQEQFLPSIRAEPLMGYGPDLPDRIRWTFTESTYITLLLRGGALLLLSYALFWAALIHRSLRQSGDRDPARRAVARAVAACAVLLIPMQALFPYFTSPGLPHLLMVLAGLAFATRSSAEEQRIARAMRLAGLAPTAPSAAMTPALRDDPLDGSARVEDCVAGAPSGGAPSGGAPPGGAPSSVTAPVAVGQPV